MRTSCDCVLSVCFCVVLQAFPDSTQLSAFELRKADDLFALGCVIAELYTLSPLFSRRSVVAFMAAALGGDDALTPRQVYWGCDVTAALNKLPGDVKVRASGDSVVCVGSQALMRASGSC